MSGIDAGLLGLCLDINWAIWAGADGVAVLKEFYSRLRMVHLRDTVKDTACVEVMGEGDVALNEIISVLREAEYPHWVLYEWSACDPDDRPPYGRNRAAKPRISSPSAELTHARWRWHNRPLRTCSSRRCHDSLGEEFMHLMAAIRGSLSNFSVHLWRRCGKAVGPLKLFWIAQSAAEAHGSRTHPGRE